MLAVICDIERRRYSVIAYVDEARRRLSECEAPE